MDEKFSTYTHVRDSNLRVAVWRDRDLPPEMIREDWEFGAHLTADELGAVGCQRVEGDDFYLYFAAPVERECPTFPPRVS